MLLFMTYFVLLNVRAYVRGVCDVSCLCLFAGGGGGGGSGSFSWVVFFLLVLFSFFSSAVEALKGCGSEPIHPINRSDLNRHRNRRIGATIFTSETSGKPEVNCRPDSHD